MLAALIVLPQCGHFVGFIGFNHGLVWDVVKGACSPHPISRCLSSTRRSYPCRQSDPHSQDGCGILRGSPLDTLPDFWCIRCRAYSTTRRGGHRLNSIVSEVLFSCLKVIRKLAIFLNPRTAKRRTKRRRTTAHRVSVVLTSFSLRRVWPPRSPENRRASCSAEFEPPPAARWHSLILCICPSGWIPHVFV